MKEAFELRSRGVRSLGDPRVEGLLGPLIELLDLLMSAVVLGLGRGSDARVLETWFVERKERENGLPHRC